VTNAALTAESAFIVTVHGPVPEQPPPDQPAKREPAADTAVSVTPVPLSNFAEQVVPQLIPGGDENTVPAPDPVLATLNPCCAAKLAVTAWSACIATVQAFVPEQPAPDQPAKREPAAGVAVSVTEVPSPYFAEQVAPQLIPAGADETVPAPEPALATVKVRGVGDRQTSSTYMAVSSPNPSWWTLNRTRTVWPANADMS
jgi:hypothetical protein